MAPSTWFGQVLLDLVITGNLHMIYIYCWLICKSNNSIPTYIQVVYSAKVKISKWDKSGIKFIPWVIYTTRVYMSCISKTACFPVNYAPHSLQLEGMRNGKALDWGHSCSQSVVIKHCPLNRTQPPCRMAKSQPIRGFPAIAGGITCLWGPCWHHWELLTIIVGIDDPTVD